VLVVFQLLSQLPHSVRSVVRSALACAFHGVIDTRNASADADHADRHRYWSIKLFGPRETPGDPFPETNAPWRYATANHETA